MPVMAIYRRDDISAELYDEFRAHAPLDASPPGALVHSYGRAGAGFVTVDIWEDRASLEAYIRDVIVPATEELGVAFQRPEVIEVETFLTMPGIRKHRVLPYARRAAAHGPGRRQSTAARDHAGGATAV